MNLDDPEDAFVAGLPVVGWIHGDRDTTALVDCLRVRFALSLRRRH